MSAVAEVLSALREVFARRQVAWYLFGAQAVAVRGAPRATQDIDVTADVSRAALPALLVDLERRDIHHRYPAIADELVRSAAVLPLRHGPTGMEIDLVLAGSGLEALALQRATMAAVDGVKVPVASATDLVVMKVLAGRGKDLEDLRALIAGGEVEVDEARDLLSQLEEALGQSDLLPALESAIRGAKR